MIDESDVVSQRTTPFGTWKVISRPGAIIHAEMLEMSDEVWRDLTTTDPNYPPPKHKHSW
ncbi:MAG TPA: hypothetical protein VLK84_26785 [Longimicrobium sp.]|nr:hypothetical protein [Longimicrobium sp.]